MALSWLTPDMWLENYDPNQVQASTRRFQNLPSVSSEVESVGEVMTTSVTIISPEATLAEARELMRAHRFRHLPVVENARLVGILSDRDILRAKRSAPLETMAVSEAMTQKLWTADPATSILTAAELMAEYRVGCLPVLDENMRLQGIVSASDVMRCLSVHAPVQAWL